MVGMIGIRVFLTALCCALVAYNSERGHRGVAVIWLAAAVASAQLTLAAVVAWRRRRRSR